MRLKGTRMIPFWCLMPKGEKIRPKQMDQLPTCEILKKSRVELLICQNTLTVKIWSLVGRMFDYGKRGSFWLLIIFTLGLSLFVPKQVCLT
jgi:hypothetical protein